MAFSRRSALRSSNPFSRLAAKFATICKCFYASVSAARNLRTPWTVENGRLLAAGRLVRIEVTSAAER
jgi:hypothetical protein